MIAFEDENRIIEEYNNNFCLYEGIENKYLWDIKISTITS